MGMKYLGRAWIKRVFFSADKMNWIGLQSALVKSESFLPGTTRGATRPLELASCES